MLVFNVKPDFAQIEYAARASDMCLLFAEYMFLNRHAMTGGSPLKWRVLDGEVTMLLPSRGRITVQVRKSLILLREFFKIVMLATNL